MSLLDRFSAAPRATGGRDADFTIEIDGAAVPVRVLRNPRARRLRLRYDAAAEELRLVVPPRGAIGAARDWTRQQGDWVRRQMAIAPAAERVAAGSRLPWGEGELLLDWAPGHPRAPQLEVEPEGPRLLLGGPADLVGRRAKRWLIERARADLGEATRALASAQGFDVASVSVGDPRSRWGSCSATRQIRYSWRLAMAPDFVRHAVVAHEVAHLAHMNHGPEFHALADRLTGADTGNSRAWLRANGPRLHRLIFD